MINPDLHAVSSTPENEQPWPLVERTLKISKPVATLSLLFGLIVLAGYLVSWEQLYRPFDNGPATHPMTAVCIALIASYFLIPGMKAIADYGRLFCILIVIVVTAIRLLDSDSLSLFVQALTPFQAQVYQDLHRICTCYRHISFDLKLSWPKSNPESTHRGYHFSKAGTGRDLYVIGPRIMEPVH